MRLFAKADTLDERGRNMKNKIIRIISISLVLAIFCMNFVGCGNTEPNQENVTRTVVDMTGSTIQIPEKVDKVFVDWASGITLVMTLGATDKLVAAPEAFETDTFAWARIICPAIDSVEKNQDAFTNVEAVLNYEPDVVITNTIDNIDIYKKLGLTAIYVTFDDNESFKESMIIVGTVLGEDEQTVAKRYNEYFDNTVAMVKERLSNISDSEMPSVYYLDSRFGDAYHTVGTGEIQEEWITYAGAKLATADAFEGRNLEITAEKFLEINPDIIMIGAQNQADVYDLLLADEVLTGLSAITNDTVYRIPMGIFPWCRNGPEAAIQVVWAAKLLHPEQFADIDVADVAKEFYKEFYGTDVSNETLSDMMAGKLCPTGK